MLNQFQLNGSVNRHFFHLESELNCLSTVTCTENFNTLFLFCYLLWFHLTVRPGIGKMLPKYITDF
jgi:hypothetical protein